MYHHSLIYSRYREWVVSNVGSVRFEKKLTIHHGGSAAFRPLETARKKGEGCGLSSQSYNTVCMFR